MYCVKCKMETKSKPGSEHIVTTKNGRNLLKTKCNVCGTTKNRFLPDAYSGPRKGSGIWDFMIANPNLIKGAASLISAAPYIAGTAYAAKKIYDSTQE